MKKKIAVIGAGIAGLSAGAYAAANGFDVEIFEQHALPGGLCTSWKRSEFVFDGCIHWLTGASGKGCFNQFWNELNALKNKKIYYHEEFARFSYSDSPDIIFYADADKLQKHLLSLSPEDSSLIKQLCRAIKKMSQLEFPLDKPFSLVKGLDIAGMMLKMIPFGRTMRFLENQSVRVFADKFKNKRIGESLKRLLYIDTMSLSSIVFTLSGLHNKSSGYPAGGSLEFARGIEKTCLERGVKFNYNTPVEVILEKENRITGLKLKDGRKIEADYIISSGDLYSALEKLLDGKLLSSPYAFLFEKEKTFPSCVQVTLGINTKYSDLPNCLTREYPVTSKINIAGELFDRISVKHYDHDPSMAPKGKSVIVVMYMTGNYSYWENLNRRKDAYKAEKETILQETLTALEEHYPGIREQVEESDVATPVSYHHYTSVWHGTFMTWLQTPENASRLRMIPNQLPEYDNLYFSGMWLMPPGGLPTGVKTSRDIIQLICNKEAIQFKGK